MRKLLLEYRKSRAGLEDMLVKLGNTEIENEDRKLINSMIRSVNEIIKWLETGRNPYFEQGIDVNRIYDIVNLSNMDVLPDLENYLISEREPLEIEKEHVLILRKIASSIYEREWECFDLHKAIGMRMRAIAEKLSI